mmetsp:Transcript_5930/g.7470  ORF Transcript_5930/g.7470 Transcript_5930/m.7470 type:complete len:170 (+) Transcript_5930:253-762(+)
MGICSSKWSCTSDFKEFAKRIALSLLCLIILVVGVIYGILEDDFAGGGFISMCGLLLLLVIHLRCCSNLGKPNSEGLVITMDEIYVQASEATSTQSSTHASEPERNLGPNEVIIDGVEDVCEIIVSTAVAIPKEEGIPEQNEQLPKATYSQSMNHFSRTLSYPISSPSL